MPFIHIYLNRRPLVYFFFCVYIFILLTAPILHKKTAGFFFWPQLFSLSLSLPFSFCKSSELLQFCFITSCKWQGVCLKETVNKPNCFTFSTFVTDNSLLNSCTAPWSSVKTTPIYRISYIPAKYTSHGDMNFYNPGLL